MTTSDDHVALMRRMYEAIAAGDVPALNEMQAPGFALTVAGAGPLSGRFEGAAAGEQFARSMELTQGQMQVEPQQLMANDDVGIALIDVTARRPDGRSLETRLIHEIRFVDGKIAGLDEWIWDQAADEAFWT